MDELPPAERAHGRPELPLVVSIPAATFTMGSADIAEAEAPNPPHVVEVSAFLLGAHPVTCAEYSQFVRATGHRAPAMLRNPAFSLPTHPVVGVAWEDASAYCRWAGGDLPTEAQWELAARGVEGRRYPWGDEAPDEMRAWFAQDWGAGSTAPVGERPAGATPLGCHDMAGNAWEWCRDVWQVDAHVARERMRRDPCVEGTTRVRPLRGGCWKSIDCKLQGAYRNWTHQLAAHDTIGFRLVVGVGGRMR